MRIIEPSVEYWEQVNPIEHVCRAAQISYQSEPKTGEAAQKFYNGLINSGHLSCLRHESIYYMIPDNKSANERYNLKDIFDKYQKCPYIEVKYDQDAYDENIFIYVATNGQFILENSALDNLLKEFKVSPKEFNKTEIGHSMMRYTFCLTTQISTTRELLRHSPQSCTELSTRYIKIGGKIEPSIVRPHWLTDKLSCEQFDYETGVERDYVKSCYWAFRNYQYLLEQDVKPQDARGVLPLDTMSKIVMTHSIKEWNSILRLRLLDKTGKAHENCHIIMQKVYDELQKLGYYFDKNDNLVYG